MLKVSAFNPCPAFTNSVDPDLLASSEANWHEEANWSGSALFAIKYVDF